MVPVVVRLWIRQDGEPPKAVAREGGRPRGPSRLVEVTVSPCPAPAQEARRIYALAQESAPDTSSGDEVVLLHWAEVEAARRRVREVS